MKGKGGDEEVEKEGQEGGEEADDADVESA
jgi:hypothetical protein